MEGSGGEGGNPEEGCWGVGQEGFLRACARTEGSESSEWEKGRARSLESPQMGDPECVCVGGGEVGFLMQTEMHRERL